MKNRVLIIDPNKRGWLSLKRSLAKKGRIEGSGARCVGRHSFIVELLVLVNSSLRLSRDEENTGKCLSTLHNKSLLDNGHYQ